jgi:hypothetical protein
VERAGRLSKWFRISFEMTTLNVEPPGILTRVSEKFKVKDISEFATDCKEI